MTAGLTDVAGNVGAELDGDPGNGRHGGADAAVDHVNPGECGGGINAAEASNGTPVVVGLTGTGAAAGDTLTVVWGGQTVDYTLLAGDISGNSATVTVPAGTITTQGDGTFNVTAALTDAVGNASANSSATSVTVDTVAPAAPSITAIPENGGGGINAAEASNGTPVVVGLAGTGAAAGDTLTVNWGSQTVTYTLLAADISGNSATVTVPLATITAQGQGTFNVTAGLTDIAGNVGPTSTATPVTVDTVAPTAAVVITAIATDSGTSSSDFVTNDTTLTVSGTHGALGSGETVQVSSDGGASWADVTTSTASTWSYTDPAPHGTSFTYQVRIVDAVGNVDANTASQAVTIDTVAPAAPSITAIPENGGGGINAAEASNGTPVVVGLAGTGAAAGDTLTINWGSQTVTYTLLAADISGNSATVTVPAGTITAQGHGTFDVTAGLTDIAGNVGANSAATPVTVDTAAPTAAVAITAIATDSGTSSSDFVTNDTTLTVSGTHGPLGPGETVQVSSDGGASWFDVTTSTASTWSYTDPTLHGTSFTYQARIVDTVGNVGANTDSQAVTIDTVAPNAPSITAIPENGGGGINAGEASNGTPVVVGLAGTGAAAGDTLSINWGGQTVTYTLLAADISGNSATVTVPLATIAAQGQGTFDVTAGLTDIAGNVGANSTATPVTVDTVAPTAEVAITAIATDSGTSSSDFITNDTTLTVSGTHGALGAGETVQVSSDGGASWFDVTTSTASTWSYTDPTPHGTSFTYQVRIVDTVGNVDANTASQAVTIDTAAPTAPSITAIPENGGGGINAAEASDGTPVVVGLAGTGAAAGDTLTVNWGSQTVTYTLLAADISGNSATVTVPVATLAAQGQGTFNVTAGLTDAAGNVSANSIGHVGNGRHGGADGGGCDHGHCHRQRHLVERLYHQRHDADGVGHARRARPRRDGAGQQRRRRQLGRCHHQHGQHLELYRSHDARHELHLPGADRRHRGQCRCQHRQPGGDHRHGGADGAVDHRDPGEWRRRHQRRRGLERHAGGGRPGGHRGGGGRHAHHQLGQPDGHLHAPGGRHLGQQRDGDGAGRDDRGAGPGHVRRDGRADRHSGQCRRQLDGALPVTVDTVAPTAAVAITAIATDSGTSSSDFITNDTTLTVSGTHGLLGPGEKVQVSSDGGANWFDATSTASTWSYTDPTLHGTSFTYQVRIVDTVGNVGANTASQAVTIDTVAPAAPSITAIPENGGGGINAAEASNGTPVVVGLAGTGAAAGDRLTINWGGQTVTYTLLAADISGNSATVTVPLATLAAQGQGTFNVTAGLTDIAGNVSANSIGHLGNGRRGGADGRGCDHGHCHRQRHLVERLYHQRHDADGVGHARRARLRRDGAGQQRRRRQLVRCHYQHGQHLELYRSDDARHELHLPGADRRHRGQRRCQHRQPGSDHRHGGAGGGGCDHGHYRRQRHVVERLYHQRHDADGFGHARPSRLRRDGAGQQRRRRQLGRCHHQHGKHLELYRSDDARHELHLPGADRRHRGQCRCQHRQPGGDHRHGGAGGAGDHRDPGE